MAGKGGRRFQTGDTDRIRKADLQQTGVVSLGREAQGGLAENQYRCESCKGVFEKNKSDDEAMKEAKEQFPNDDLSDAAVVCDICFNAIMAWHAIHNGESAS